MTEKEFIEEWAVKIKAELLKEFPGIFVEGVECIEVKLPGKVLLLGQELFGSFEIIDSGGNVFFQAQNMAEAKYYLYANRNKPAFVFIPVDEKEIEKKVKEYEASLDQILMTIEKDFKLKFTGAKNFHEVSNKIFHTLNLQRY
jgi:hypothetical protein